MAKKGKTQAAATNKEAVPEHTGDSAVEIPDVFDEAIAAQNEATQPGQPDGEQRQWVDRGPRSRHTIDLGDGRAIRFSHWDKWQQNRIEFIAKKEDVDPRPSKEDTQFMKENGYRWRAEDKAWTRQFFTDDDKARIADAEQQEGKEAASRLRAQIRAASDQVAQDIFLQAGNHIRERNGLPAVDHAFGEERSR